MSNPYYTIEHDSDGWWSVYRNGGWRCDEFLTLEQAEAAIDRWEKEDEENEREARDQDADKGDWRYHQDHDQ